LLFLFLGLEMGGVLNHPFPSRVGFCGSVVIHGCFPLPSEWASGPQNKDFPGQTLHPPLHFWSVPVPMLSSRNPPPPRHPPPYLPRGPPVFDFQLAQPSSLPVTSPPPQCLSSAADARWGTHLPHPTVHLFPSPLFFPPYILFFCCLWFLYLFFDTLEPRLRANNIFFGCFFGSGPTPPPHSHGSTYGPPPIYCREGKHRLRRSNN